MTDDGGPSGAAALGPLATRAAEPDRQKLRFLRAVAATLAGTVLVILFGAVVRITGSGAGCGQHWPTCQGEVTHLPRSLETLIEYTHRLTSGLAGLAVLALTVWAFRAFGPGHRVRLWSVLSLVFMAIEALIGMLLVRLALVGEDASVARAIVMPLHLVNTSLLIGAMTLTAFYCWSARSDVPSDPRGAALSGLAILGTLLVSATGAVTALGDTIYPAQAGPGLAQLAHDQSEAAHFLERARGLHPIAAVLLIVLMLVLLPRVAERGSAAAKGLARVVLVLFLAQGAVGTVNVWLSAPGAMQLLHLFVTCLIWLSLVLLAAELWAPRLSWIALQGRASGSSFEGGPTST